VFRKFEFRNINFTEDHVRRIFSGNGLNQKGLLNYAQQSEYKKEILKLMAEFFEVTINLNFDLFKKVFAKIPPITLAKCQLGVSIENPSTQKFVVSILKAYFEGR